MEIIQVSPEQFKTWQLYKQGDLTHKAALALLGQEVFDFLDRPAPLVDLTTPNMKYSFLMFRNRVGDLGGWSGAVIIRDNEDKIKDVFVSEPHYKVKAFSLLKHASECIFHGHPDQLFTTSLNNGKSIKPTKTDSHWLTIQTKPWVLSYETYNPKKSVWTEVKELTRFNKQEVMLTFQQCLGKWRVNDEQYYYNEETK